MFAVVLERTQSICSVQACCASPWHRRFPSPMSNIGCFKLLATVSLANAQTLHLAWVRSSPTSPTRGRRVGFAREMSDGSNRKVGLVDSKRCFGFTAWVCQKIWAPRDQGRLFGTDDSASLRCPWHRTSPLQWSRPTVYACGQLLTLSG